MTPDEIRELRCECGHGALDTHTTAGCWECRCGKDEEEALASELTERLAQAWDKGWGRGRADWWNETRSPNPYRSHADSGRSAGALSDEQGSARVVGRGEGSGAERGDEA